MTTGHTKASKVVLITGCSSGFGFLTALKLSSQGHIVYASLRDLDKGQPLIKEARRIKCDHLLHLIQLDVTRLDSIKNAISEIVTKQGVIDVLVNNAGFGVGGFFEDLSPEDFQRQFDVNFFGVLNVTREVLPVMRPRRKGKIINISSMASFAGTPCFSAYCSSKWALEGFSECLYMELEPFGINVSLVEPGSYRTNIFEQNASYGKNFDNPESPYYHSSQNLRNRVAKHINSIKKDPDEVAQTINQIVDSSDPPFRNVIGWSNKLRLLLTRIRLVPFKFYAGVVNMVLAPSEKLND